jgi:hypothetical protein
MTEDDAGWVTVAIAFLVSCLLVELFYLGVL